MRRIFLGLFGILLGLLAIAVVRTTTVKSRQISALPAPLLQIDRDAAVRRLSQAIRFRTISHPDFPKPEDRDAFLAWLPTAYPRVHASMRREQIGRSVLYTWEGSEKTLKPLLLMGHYDVVPVEPAAEEKWTHPPFGGSVAGGYVWGRGSLDDKITVISILEAADMLLARGARPKRTIVLAFGDDEENGGTHGAVAVAKVLASRGITFDAILDEGGAITTGVMKGINGPVATIGIAEKGFANVEISATGEGGHFSMPPMRTAVGLVAGAVDRVQQHPMRAGIRGATEEMLQWLAPEMPYPQRLMMSNPWLFEPLLRLEAARSTTLNALLRTTTAPTMIAGGVRDNIIPVEASAVVNFRILPGDSSSGVLSHVREAIGDAAVKIRLTREIVEPSPVSDPSAPQFAALQKCVESVFPSAVVVPFLTVGGTDARHFTDLSPNVYRFLPVQMAAEDLDRIHGINERVSVPAYFDAIRFYGAVMREWGRGDGTLNAER